MIFWQSASTDLLSVMGTKRIGFGSDMRCLSTARRIDNRGREQVPAEEVEGRRASTFVPDLSGDENPLTMC